MGWCLVKNRGKFSFTYKLLSLDFFGGIICELTNYLLWHFTRYHAVFFARSKWQVVRMRFSTAGVYDGGPHMARGTLFADAYSAVMTDSMDNNSVPLGNLNTETLV
jgi:hypothetical protein